MKILKLLNKKLFSIIFISIFSLKVLGDEKPVDIWNIDQNETNSSL